MTWFSTFITDRGPANITSWPSYNCLLRFVKSRREQCALSTLLPHHAYFVNCSKFICQFCWLGNWCPVLSLSITK